MAKKHSVPRISHTVNGYSRYDIPESVALTATPGILYPVRVDFMNPRDCRYIQCGATVRTNPALVPTFSPYRIRLHRYFCPISLYHPEMRVNSSGFDYRNLTTNLIWTYNTAPGPASTTGAAAIYRELSYHSPRTLLSFLGLTAGDIESGGATHGVFPNNNGTRELSGVPVLGSTWVNADPVLCYYDIVRNYYGFSQLDDVSFAVPNLNPGSNEAFASGLLRPRLGASVSTPLPCNGRILPNYLSTSKTSYWPQYIGSLKAFDNFFETSFYPVKGRTSTYFDLTGELYAMIIDSVSYLNPNPDVQRNYTMEEIYNTYVTASQVNNPGTSNNFGLWSFITQRLPFGVAPSMADRFSRSIDPQSVIGGDINIDGVSTVRQLAIAAKTQAYADLLTSGGSRFTDFVKTFFAANVSHVDRPVLVYSSSFYLNSSPIFNQSGTGTLGAYGGVIEGNNSFGKRQQRYCFDEPGYLIDVLSIQPLYYWAGIQNDYARYDKMDYFNPLFNEVGYQTLPYATIGIHNITGNRVFAKEPCYNEYRASFDRVLGDMAFVPGLSIDKQPNVIYTSWVQQRSAAFNDQNNDYGQYARSLRFVDISQSNSCFASNLEDNFFINLYYNVSSKSLVSKNFATNLSTR